jgi:transcription elongation GreA/GreB family factor
VQVVSVKSPLGRALLGKRAGEDVDVRLPERTRELSILSVE